MREGLAEGEEFARRSKAEGDAAGEAFEVLNAAKFLADFAADDGLLQKMRDDPYVRDLMWRWAQSC